MSTICRCPNVGRMDLYIVHVAWTASIGCCSVREVFLFFTRPTDKYCFQTADRSLWWNVYQTFRLTWFFSLPDGSQFYLDLSDALTTFRNTGVGTRVWTHIKNIFLHRQCGQPGWNPCNGVTYFMPPDRLIVLVLSVVNFNICCNFSCARLTLHIVYEYFTYKAFFIWH